jgi:hypothetical protein
LSSSWVRTSGTGTSAPNGLSHAKIYRIANEGTIFPTFAGSNFCARAGDSGAAFAELPGISNASAARRLLDRPGHGEIEESAIQQLMKRAECTVEVTEQI